VTVVAVVVMMMMKRNVAPSLFRFWCGSNWKSIEPNVLFFFGWLYQWLAVENCFLLCLVEEEKITFFKQMLLHTIHLNNENIKLWTVAGIFFVWLVFLSSVHYFSVHFDFPLDSRFVFLSIVQFSIIDFTSFIQFTALFALHCILFLLRISVCVYVCVAFCFSSFAVYEKRSCVSNGNRLIVFVALRECFALIFFSEIFAGGGCSGFFVACFGFFVSVSVSKMVFGFADGRVRMRIYASVYIWFVCIYI